MSRRMLAALVLAAAMAGCGDDADEPSSESLSGIWNATQVEFTSSENPAQVVDLVAEGWVVTLNLSDTGPFAFTATPPDGEPETVTGSWSYTSDTFTLQPAGLPFAWVFDLDLGNDEMTITGADVEYDLDGDEVDEPATLTMRLVRD